MTAPKKSKAELKSAFKEFLAQNPPAHGNGNWMKRTLSEDELDLVAEMYQAGYGPKYIAQFLIGALGYKDASGGKVSTFTDTLAKGGKAT